MHRARRMAIAILLIAVPLAGCITPVDDALDAMADESPVSEVVTYALPDVITALDPLATLDLGAGGTGIWLDEDRSLLYSANHGNGVTIVDVSNPADPVQIGHVGDIYARDVDMLVVGDRVLVLAAGASEGMHIIDATNASAPVLVATSAAYSVHNVASIPGTTLVYNSDGGPMLPGERRITVIDVADPENPIWYEIPIPDMVNGIPIQSNGCHDITVRVDLGRAYCGGGGNFYAAGGGETFIWDISEDPLKPRWIGVIDNPSIMYHHQALPTEDGNLLLINDEFIAPNCRSANVAGTSVGQTTAAMWVYDISDPARPELVSWVQPQGDGTEANCGSHFGDLIDGTSVIVWGWYQGGTLLIDLADPANPVILDRQGGSSTWDARYMNGVVYGSAGTLEVYTLV